MMMFEAFIPAIIMVGGVLIANTLLFLLISRRVNMEKRKLVRTLKLYLEKPDDDSPSQLGILIDTTSKNLAAHLLSTFKAASLGVASGEAKREKALDGAIAEDMLGQAHPLAALATQLPGVAQLIKKNPLIAQTLAARLAQGGLNLSVPGNGKPDKKGNILDEMGKFNEA